MKVAILSFYSGNVYRGVETFVHELANRLVDKNEVIVFQSGPKLPNSKYTVIQIPIKIDMSKKNIYVPYINYFSRKNMEFVMSVLKQIPSDVDVIFPTNGQWQSLLCKFWAIKNHKKMIIAGQSGPGIDDRLNLLTFPDYFITLTDFQTAWAKKANPFIKIKKIPNGVDLNKFKLNTKTALFDLPHPVIMCAAAFDFWKRNDLIIKAVSKMENGSLLLVGKGEDQVKLQKLGDQLLPSRFKILSFSHDQMPSVYCDADIFTYATVPWESFGIVLIEAMASGLPVVATDDQIRREIIGNAGLFVDPTNTEEYAKTLEKALSMDWGGLPRRQAEKFSWDKIAEDYGRLFSSLK